DNSSGSWATGRLLLRQRAEPTEQMRIATQFGDILQLRSTGTQVGEEAMRRDAISTHSAGPARQSQIPDLLLEKLLQLGGGIRHDADLDGIVCRCAFRWHCDIRARHPLAPTARRAWWCGSGSDP